MSDELWKMTAVEAVARLRKKEITPLELVEASAKRIAEVEPAVNAMPTLCLDRARDHAKKIMAGGAACEAAGEAGWLAGLPVSIKDLTDVAGVRTTYGSPIFADHVPTRSHPLVERIEALGGIVMGKSNTPEFGAGGSTFNEVFGRTRNPWNTSLTCGGSTGGGSVSVATGEVWLAHGLTTGVAAPARHLLLDRRHLSLGRPALAARRTTSTRRSVGAGPDGAQHPRSGAIPRRDGGILPARRDDLRCAGRVFQRRCRQSGRAPGGSPGRPTSAAASSSTATSARSAPRWRGASRSWAASSRRRRRTSARSTRSSWRCAASNSSSIAASCELEQHRDKIKPDIIWNTELGFKQTTRQLAAWAERERAALYFDGMVECPGRSTTCW